MNRMDEWDTQDKRQNIMVKVRFGMEALTLYSPLLQDDILKSLYSLLIHLGTKDADVFHLVNLYSALNLGLLKIGSGLKAYIIEKILHAENPFTRAAEMNGMDCLTESMEAAVINDLDHLYTIASLQPDMLKNWIADRCIEDKWQKDAVMNLPKWVEGEDDPILDDSASEHSCAYLKNLLMQSSCWHDCRKALSEFHHQWGSGIFSKYSALVWKQGKQERGFAGVDYPDPIRLADLISYEAERSEVIDNTLRFLEGYPANNILLYGDRGTGKSSTVKALLNEYHTMGLRVIEIPKKLLTDYPIIIRQLAGRNLKFILFVDDLAFEDNEENYTALKAALEGGLESKPSNVLIYATSNRKHLIKEKFSDRAGLVSGNADDEIRSGDSIQEKLSLSDRFGMTVVFSSPDKKRYLQIVEGIIKSRGLEVEQEFLHKEALKWELWYNGRSPRTARQFADWLEGTIKHGNMND